MYNGERNQKKPTAIIIESKQTKETYRNNVKIENISINIVIQIFIVKMLNNLMHINKICMHIQNLAQKSESNCTLFYFQHARF